ncbi:beta-lactamase regulating signal transducer with metallopeptidase domain [Sphingomonas jinjuensis]|uniref:Beta-lactamase regulating signal transducer with metallopeptidase domain n=1 Tax=Sphingomonas jinjuensis TaxID=535907 RepID=A0A840FCN9_9SPHN|nr:M56 family metallopeptidase [Sphingomonas jinjuensis]MBB4153327.1 beta-lactamase regulating signal transducer with metallopeptidase domain [Sphingomonas jinjuensis]
MIAWAIEALIASAALMALVLLVRGPVRRAFGPGVAYALWALPLLRLLMPPLPAEWHEAAVSPISQAGETITVLVIEPAGMVAAPVSSFPSLGLVLALLWSAGAAVFLIWHSLRHASFCRRLLRGATRVGRHGAIEVIESPAVPGPLAFGIFRRYVAFPRDFAERYDTDERDLALAHELGHHARGDLVANWTALIVLALHWFNPIAWRAFRAFRADQELANDARVLAGRSAFDRHAYACAIVKTAHGGNFSAACHLHAVDNLKGRLKMLNTSRRSRRRIAAGTASVAAIVCAGLGLTASGTQAAERIKTATGIDLDQIEAAIPAPATVPAVPATAAQPAAPTLAAMTPAKRDGKDKKRVVVVKNGESKVYEGADADAYLAAHPDTMPPMPAMTKMPPMPPMPPVASMDAARANPPMRPEHYRVMFRRSDVPQVSSTNCPGDNLNPTVINTRDGHQQKIVICTNRIEAQAKRGEAMAARAAEMQVNAGEIRRSAMSAALASLKATRAQMASNRDMGEEARNEVLASLDESIAELRSEMNSKD